MKGYKTVGFEAKMEEEEEVYTVPEGLKQYYSMINDEFKLMHLISFLYNNAGKKIILFVSTCECANLLEILLKNFAFLIPNKPLFKEKILKLHGKMDHHSRRIIFKQFNEPEPGILICTDVAARGLDFPFVDWIVHYDLNPDPKDYLNRMGRTARLNSVGSSLVFLMECERPVLTSCLVKFDIKEIKSGKILLEFVKKMNETLKAHVVVGEDEQPPSPIYCTPQSFEDEVDENEKYRKKYIFIIYPLQKAIKDYVFINRDNLIQAKKAFKSSIRAFSSFFKFNRDVFNVKNLNLSRYVRI